MSSTLVPNPGQIARVRQRLYLVEQIVPPPNAGDSTLVRLSCVDDDNQGQPLEVLWEREIDTARRKRPHGQIRQSQLITTFGPGAMLDLPNYSVLVAGLDYWLAGGEDVYEPRLTEKLRVL